MKPVLVPVPWRCDDCDELATLVVVDTTGDVVAYACYVHVQNFLRLVYPVGDPSAYDDHRDNPSRHLLGSEVGRA